jgi:hypothetical protein
LVLLPQRVDQTVTCWPTAFYCIALRKSEAASPISPMS